MKIFILSTILKRRMCNAVVQKEKYAVNLNFQSIFNTMVRERRHIRNLDSSLSIRELLIFGHQSKCKILSSIFHQSKNAMKWNAYANSLGHRFLISLLFCLMHFNSHDVEEFSGHSFYISPLAFAIILTLFSSISRFEYDSSKIWAF